MYTYLLINLFTISIPFIFTFHPRLQFYKTWYAFWPAVLITAFVFIAWDVVFADMGIWGFNPDYLIGIYWLGLPIEEWMFFICIPYACVFTYACLKILCKDIIPNPRLIAQIICGVLLIVGLLTIGRWYTSVTFLSTAVFLGLLIKSGKTDWLGHYFMAYVVIFAMPFLLVNGILTGSFIQDEVVWYNNAENLSFRIFTIPIEDFVYGFLLYIMNVTLYEIFIERRSASSINKSIATQGARLNR